MTQLQTLPACHLSLYFPTTLAIAGPNALTLPWEGSHLQRDGNETPPFPTHGNN